ncbi:MAG: FAD-dependent oxidoreductase [Gammaproteobacteria bacterium]|nr:FAD-dependent oxidoreductase [Gammaproteobacteria bacterium]
MTAPDVIIVGAGLNGLLTARECRQAGLLVTVIDRSAAATPASWAAGGILSPLQPWHEQEATLALARAGRALYPPLVEWLSAVTGIDVGYFACGMLVLAPDNSDEITGWAKQNGETCRLLQDEQLDAAEPAIGDEFNHGLLLPDVHQIRNPRLLKALHQALAGDEVGIVPAAGTVRLLIEGTSCQGVEVDDVGYPADRVVLAAGAWSGQLLADIEPQLPLRPMRGQMLAYEADPGLLRHILLHRRHYLVPRQEGLILAGSTVEDVGFDTATTTAAAQDLQAMAGRLLPPLADPDTRPSLGRAASGHRRRPALYRRPPGGRQAVSELRSFPQRRAAGPGLGTAAGRYHAGPRAVADGRLVCTGTIGRRVNETQPQMVLRP